MKHSFVGNLFYEFNNKKWEDNKKKSDFLKASTDDGSICLFDRLSSLLYFVAIGKFKGRDVSQMNRCDTSWRDQVAFQFCYLRG